MADIVTGAELAAHLGGAADATLCDLCANAASAAVAVIVDPLDLETDPIAVWSDDVRWAGLIAGSDLYARAMSAPGGAYQLDEFVTGNVAVTSNFIHKLTAVISAHRAVGGMAG